VLLIFEMVQARQSHRRVLALASAEHSLESP